MCVVFILELFSLSSPSYSSTSSSSSSSPKSIHPLNTVVSFGASLHSQLEPSLHFRIPYRCIDSDTHQHPNKQQQKQINTWPNPANFFIVFFISTSALVFSISSLALPPSSSPSSSSYLPLLLPTISSLQRLSPAFISLSLSYYLS